MGTLRTTLSCSVSVAVHVAALAYSSVSRVEHTRRPVPAGATLEIIDRASGPGPAHAVPPPPSSAVLHEALRAPRRGHAAAGPAHRRPVRRRGIPGTGTASADGRALAAGSALPGSVSTSEEEMGPPCPQRLSSGAISVIPDPVAIPLTATDLPRAGPPARPVIPFSSQEMAGSLGVEHSDANIDQGHPEPAHPGGDSLATGGGRIGVSSGGAGVGFDFYSPLDFNKEMARARKEHQRIEGDYQAIRNTDHGHGIICNTGGSWFLCEHRAMDTCNAAHGDSCRYAREAERLELDEPIVF